MATSRLGMSLHHLEERTILHQHYLPLALSRPQACNCHRVAGRNFPTTWSFSPTSPFDNVIFLFVAEEDCFEPSFGILRNLNEEKCQRPEAATRAPPAAFRCRPVRGRAAVVDNGIYLYPRPTTICRGIWPSWAEAC